MFKAVLLIAVLSCVRATIDHALCKVDMVICLDNTGSIDSLPDGSDDPANPPTNWKLIIDFAQDLVRELTVSPTFSQVGLVDFGAKARIQFDLDQYTTKDEVINAIGHVPFVGDTTNTTGGLFVSRIVLTDPQYGGRNGFPKLVVLVTDGDPNVEKETVNAEAQNLRDAGVRVIVVGITELVREDIMKSIAYTPNDYVYAPDFSNLDGITKLVLNDESCTVVTTTKAPPATTKPPPGPTTTHEPIVYC